MTASGLALLLALSGAWSAQVAETPSGGSVDPATPFSLGRPGVGPGGTIAGILPRELAGRSLGTAPWFETVRTFRKGDAVELAIEPAYLPSLSGAVVDVYVAEHRSTFEWLTNPDLSGAVRGPIQLAFSKVGLQTNTFLIEKGTLSADAGSGIGRGYDVVIDVDRDGLLGKGDVIDGLGDVAGFYVVHDVTRPGPYAVARAQYSGGALLKQDTHYPQAIAGLGRLPLVVISHGNGHDYKWYGHLGRHLASYGFIVMSHVNNTGPGIETASQTTLDNVDYFLGNLDTIQGGIFQGHVDGEHMAWIGHSRGGEGIVRAYDRLFRGLVSYSTYDRGDVRLLSSMAPTVFLGRAQSNPRRAAYHLWTAVADTDVNGCASCDVCQTFRLLERSTRTRASISLYGVGHADLHAGGGDPFADGPCLLGKSRTHRIMRGYSLPLVAWFLRGEPAAEDFLWRQWESFRPIGAPNANCAVVNLMYRRSKADGSLVLDDYQANPNANVSSSGGSITFDVDRLTEGRLDDANVTFTHDLQDPMNGMTAASLGEPWKGVVFEWNQVDRHYTLEVPASARDLRRFEFLSFRASQSTRHPLTRAELGDLVFSVSLVDSELDEAVLRIDTYGGGIEEPYQRTGSNCGVGAGWANEFETIRIRTEDFTRETNLDLDDVIAVQFLFGPSYGSLKGRIGLDDIQLEPFDSSRKGL